jgi:hypothetical protein
VQFAAVPWLRGYLNDQIARIVDSAEPTNHGKLRPVSLTERCSRKLRPD